MAPGKTSRRKSSGQKPDGREEQIRNKFWRTLKRAASQAPFAEEFAAAYYCAFDEKTPWRVRGVLLGALAYFVMPADAVPDFLVAIGFTDDVAVLTVAITTVGAHIKPAHRAAAKRALAEMQS
jgi:uncharacterized membrane protein YkvA (DUF1232 family)